MVKIVKLINPKVVTITVKKEIIGLEKEILINPDYLNNTIKCTEIDVQKL